MKKTALHNLFPINMTETEEVIQNQLFTQMSGLGFCLVTNVNNHDEQSLLKAMKAFHALPLQVKLSMSPKHLKPGNKSCYNGYFPFV